MNEKKKINDKVIGISKFNSKSGNPCCKVFVLKPCTENQNKYGTYGFFVKEEWIPEHLQDRVTIALIGSEVKFEYIASINDYGQARAEISDIIVL